jgi:hypothetical protein
MTTLTSRRRPQYRHPPGKGQDPRICRSTRQRNELTNTLFQRTSSTDNDLVGRNHRASAPDTLVRTSISHRPGPQAEVFCFVFPSPKKNNRHLLSTKKKGDTHSGRVINTPTTNPSAHSACRPVPAQIRAPSGGGGGCPAPLCRQAAGGGRPRRERERDVDTSTVAFARFLHTLQ